MERERIESIIESLLFVAGEPVSKKRMFEVISEASREEVSEALQELVRKWDRPERGLRVVEVAGGYSSVFLRRSDGTVIAWGGNNLGQTTVPSRPPWPELHTMAPRPAAARPHPVRDAGLQPPRQRRGESTPCSVICAAEGAS